MNKNFLKFSAFLGFSILLVLFLFKYMPERFPGVKLDNQNLASLSVTTLILLTVLYNSFANNNSKALLKGILLWQGIFLVLIIGYAFRFELNYVYQRAAMALIPSYKWVDEQGKITISRNIDGHFYIDAIINEKQVKFMIDTGASGIALTKDDAALLGFDIAKLDYSKVFYTANGTNASAPVSLVELKIGPKTFNNVRAYVNGGSLDVSLLGMSIIERFKSFKIDNDLLILSY